MRIELEEVQYSIIYTANIYCFDEEQCGVGKERPVSIKRYFPPKGIIGKMTRTEDSTNHMEGDEVVAHGKWCGILAYDEFQQLLIDTGMRVEKVDTMGSLGAPGFDFGWAPAVCFQAASDYYLPPDWTDDVMAYVTPLITDEQAKEWDLPDSENAWEFIKHAMWGYNW